MFYFTCKIHWVPTGFGDSLDSPISIIFTGKADYLASGHAHVVLVIGPFVYSEGRASW